MIIDFFEKIGHPTLSSFYYYRLCNKVCFEVRMYDSNKINLDRKSRKDGNCGIEVIQGHHKMRSKMKNYQAEG